MGDILRRCQGEGRPYLPVRPEPSTTKSARELGGRTDGRTDAGPAPPPPGLAAAAAAPRAGPRCAPRAPPPGGMSYKPNLAAHMPAASLSAAGSVHPPTTSMATSSQYRQLLSDYGPPSLGYTQGTGNSQVPQSKYAELLAIIEELGKEIRPTYAGSKSAMERLKRGIIHARGLVRECLAETERNARS
ncbi:cyclin-dependent kinase 2-associated protein 1 isoform X1 [Rousettus aegyptiacus]|uniref:Cyclin dependent kinase 2 associated protein 1 n=1 Tax=Rousettus aegyptiacus TaxID=9407 RepID=A0A7J8GWS9_ROUAE|nr:cyclin-dependent kinase 2-associated protein 1 isoform X1 [Rousettus aegyptiacus]KAF6464456.1 cyclin dependent kinase 2 associated protein 1 [Rousettus aegyptiacus]